MAIDWIHLFLVSVSAVSNDDFVCRVLDDENSLKACQPQVTASVELQRSIEGVFEDVVAKKSSTPEFSEMVCRGTDAKIVGKDGTIGFVKLKSEIPGAIMSHLGSRDDSSSDLFHILTENKEVLRYDPVKKELLKATLPAEYAKKIEAAQFDSTGRYLKLSSSPESPQDAGDASTRLDLDQLFAKTKTLVDSSSLGASSLGTNAEIRPVQFDPQPETSKNLVLYDPQSQEIWDFPFDKSVRATLAAGTSLKDKSIGFNRDEASALSVGENGEARIWSQPKRQKLSGLVAGSTVLGANISSLNDGTTDGVGPEENAGPPSASLTIKAPTIAIGGSPKGSSLDSAKVLMGDSAQLLERAMALAENLVDRSFDEVSTSRSSGEIESQIALERAERLVTQSEDNQSHETQEAGLTERAESQKFYIDDDGILRVQSSSRDPKSGGPRESPQTTSSDSDQGPGRLFEELSQWLWTIPERKRRRVIK